MTLQEKVESLEKEAAELREWLAGIEAKVKEKKSRLVEIVGDWHGWGDLKRAMCEIRDSQFPILTGSLWNTYRIVAVDDKWISVRRDKDEDVKRYHRATGCKERTRSGYDTIDIAKALAIWAEHQTQPSTPPNATGEKV